MHSLHSSPFIEDVCRRLQSNVAHSHASVCYSVYFFKFRTSKPTQSRVEELPLGPLGGRRSYIRLLHISYFTLCSINTLNRVAILKQEIQIAPRSTYSDSKTSCEAEPYSKTMVEEPRTARHRCPADLLKFCETPPPSKKIKMSHCNRGDQTTRCYIYCTPPPVCWGSYNRLRFRVQGSWVPRQQGHLKGRWGVLN